MNATPGIEVFESLIQAVNRHDLDALVGHFADDVRSTTPAHPARSFTGRDQVRRNWGQILGAIRDLEATVVSSSSGPGHVPGAETVWAELAFDGHRPDGAPWRMRGVTVNEVLDGRIAAVGFYMEPIDEAGEGADEAIRRATGSVAEGTPPATMTAGGVR